MVAPTNPASAAAVNPANAVRHPGSGKESSEKPASSARPFLSTRASDQSDARIRGTGGNGSVSQDSEPTPSSSSSASSSAARENLGSGLQPTPSSSASASASRPKLESSSEPTPNASSTCNYLGSGLETGEHSFFNPSSEGLPGLDEATAPGGTSTENPPDTTTDGEDVVMVEGGTVEAPAEDTRSGDGCTHNSPYHSATVGVCLPNWRTLVGASIASSER